MMDQCLGRGRNPTNIRVRAMAGIRIRVRADVIPQYRSGPPWPPQYRAWTPRPTLPHAWLPRLCAATRPRQPRTQPCWPWEGLLHCRARTEQPGPIHPRDRVQVRVRVNVWGKCMQGDTSGQSLWFNPIWCVRSGLGGVKVRVRVRATVRVRVRVKLTVKVKVGVR